MKWKALANVPLSGLFLICGMSSAFGDNAISRDLYRLAVDSSQSTAQRIDGLSGVPSAPPVGFGGFIDVRVTNYFVDTHFNGTPIAPKYFSSILLNFDALVLPEQISDFAPEFSFDVFKIEDGLISGSRHDPCAFERATGASCTWNSFVSGDPGGYQGSFDGSQLEIAGQEAHGYSSDYYTFSLVASPVPVPPAALLLAPTISLLLFRRRRAAHTCSVNRAVGAQPRT